MCFKKPSLDFEDPSWLFSSALEAITDASLDVRQLIGLLVHRSFPKFMDRKFLFRLKSGIIMCSNQCTFRNPDGLHRKHGNHEANTLGEAMPGIRGMNQTFAVLSCSKFMKNS